MKRNPVSCLLNRKTCLVLLLIIVTLAHHNPADAFFFRTLTLDRDGSGWIFNGSFYYGDEPHDYMFYYPVPKLFNIWISNPLIPPYIVQTAVPGDSDRFDEWETNDLATDGSTDPTIGFFLNQDTTTTAKFIPWNISIVSVTADSMNAAMTVYADRNLAEVNLNFEYDQINTSVYNTQAGNIVLTFNQNDILLYGNSSITVKGKQGDIERTSVANVFRREASYEQSDSAWNFHFWFPWLGYKVFPATAIEYCNELNYTVFQMGNTTNNVKSQLGVNFINSDWYTNSNWTAQHRFVLYGTTEDWSTLPDNVTGWGQQYSKARKLSYSSKWTNPIRGEFKINVVYQAPEGDSHGIPILNNVPVNF